MRTVWQQLLDRLAVGETLICADEIRRWDMKEWEEALGLGLLREIELSESTICDQCGDAHWAGIYWEVPGVKACFGCDTEGVIDIEIDRLRQWRIDADRVAALIAGALDLPAQAEMLLPERLWRIGRRRLGGRYRDIFFGIGEGVSVSAMSAAIRSSIGHGSALLLTLGSNANPDGLPAGQHLLDLTSITGVTDGRIKLDLNYLEEWLAEGATPVEKPTRSIPAPAGATWRDVSIIVFEGFLQVTICSKVREIDFAELGVEQGSQPVQLMKCFAAARGTLDASKIIDLMTGTSPVKARVLRLRKLLQALIELDGDPIEHNGKARSYSCQFEVQLSGDDGFRTPAGATWLDFTFHERADGRLDVSVAEKQRFRVYGAKDGAGRSAGEVGEDDQAITRVYSLEEMGLRSPRGQLAPEGILFVKFLRSRGMIPCAGNEMAVVKLAERLREWAGLTGDPIQLVKASRWWTAVFACSSTAESV